MKVKCDPFYLHYHIPLFSNIFVWMLWYRLLENVDVLEYGANSNQIMMERGTLSLIVTIVWMPNDVMWMVSQLKYLIYY